jgi:hypothetical protein
MEGFTFSLPEGADYSQMEWGSADAQANLASIMPASGGGGGGGGNGGGGSLAPTSTPPTPVIPPPAATTYAVKQPSPSLVTYNAETLPQELIVDLLFEDVGGTELINVSRHDTINGQNVVYSLVSNLSILNRSFNPNNILAGQISYSQFSQYSLDIASKLIGISLDEGGNLVIEFSSIGNDEYAEIELSSDGTIYRIGVVVPT